MRARARCGVSPGPSLPSAPYLSERGWATILAVTPDVRALPKWRRDQAVGNGFCGAGHGLGWGREGR